MYEIFANVPEGSKGDRRGSNFYRKCYWKSASYTIDSYYGRINIHPRRPRLITNREIARLQSFPDDFIFQGSKVGQLRQLSNATPPLLGKAIALAVEKSLIED